MYLYYPIILLDLEITFKVRHCHSFVVFQYEIIKLLTLIEGND